VITQDIRKRLAAIENELNLVVLERPDLVHGLLVARIAALHLLMLGPGGSGKSMLAREFASHVQGGSFFGTLLFEGSDPAMVFGPTNIKAMAEDGVAERVLTGMLPEATDAFIDEIFNANTPVLHGLQSILHERIFHNGAKQIDVPLRTMVAGSNKVNADVDLVAFFDRLHMRFEVNYLRVRDNQKSMVVDAIARMAQVGRGGLSTSQRTMVSVDELETAHQEALALPIDDAVFDQFLDLREKLDSDGIVISDRRMVDGMAAVKANAWLRDHATIRVGDLDILASMWWTTLEDEPKAQKVILELANPLLNKARELTEIVDDAKRDYDASRNLDKTVKVNVASEVSLTTRKTLEEVRELIAQGESEGIDVSRLKALRDRTYELHVEVGTNWGLTRENAAQLLETADA